MNDNRQFCLIKSINSDTKYAEQYLVAFELIYNSNKKNNQVSMPMLFLARHYIEVSLKINIKYFATYSKSKSLLDKLNDIHDLCKLRNAMYQHWNIVKKTYNLEQLNNEEKKFKTTLDDLINILHKIDKHSYSFRYSEDKDHNKNLNDISINCKEIKEKMDIIKYYLNHTISVFKGLVELSDNN